MCGDVRTLIPSLLVTLAATFLITDPCAAQRWPQQNVRIIVPFPVGGAVDTAARVLADGLSKRWDRPVVVENKPGGETTIGAAAFVSAQDGHTLLYTTFGTLTVAPLTVEKLSYNPDNDLLPLVTVASIVVVVAATNSLPIATLADLEAVIRARPGQLAWSSSPTLPRYVFSAFLKQRGLDMTYVGYRDASQPQVDLGEGRLHALITAIPTAAAPVSAGKARFLAVTEPRRTMVIPDVPTAAESGYDEFTFIGGAGLFGWRDMPQLIRDRIVDDVNAVLADSNVRQRLRAGGQDVVGGGPELLKDLIARQRTRVLELSGLLDLKSLR